MVEIGRYFVHVRNPRIVVKIVDIKPAGLVECEVVEYLIVSDYIVECIGARSECPYTAFVKSFTPISHVKGLLLDKTITERR